MSDYIEYVHDPEATGNKNTATTFVVSQDTADIIEYERQRVKMGLGEGVVILNIGEEELEVDTNLLFRVQ